MSLWIQQGYGKSDKIDRLAETGSIGGVVLSPADEERETLAATASAARDHGLEVMLDPQTYVGSITGGTARCHESHGLDFGRIHWGLNPTQIADHVAAVVLANETLGISTICAPTCIQRGFGDAWTTLAIQYARTTVDAAESVYVSVAIEEAALSDWNPIEAWLDVVTTLDAKGFYLIVARARGDYPQPWDVTRLTNLLRLIHRLSVLNNYEVVLGYSDFEGLLAQAAGARAFASGWYYTLRAFTESKWQPSSGGGAARARATSPSLLTAFRAEDEGYRIARSEDGALAFPDAALRDRLERAEETIGLPESWLQHLGVLGAASNSLGGIGALTDQRHQLRQQLDNASALLDGLQTAGVLLPAAYQTRVSSYLAALAEFEALENPT